MCSWKTWTERWQNQKATKVQNSFLDENICSEQGEVCWASIKEDETDDIDIGCDCK